MGDTNDTRDRRFTQLTGEECARIADSLEESSRFLNLIVAPTSDFATMIARMRSMGARSGLVFATELDSDARTERNRAFLRVEQAKRLAATLHACRSLRGVERVLPRLKKQFDRFSTQVASAQDFLSEMETAARLSKRGLDVCFAEPDIVVQAEHGAFGIAVKRVRSLSSFKARLSEGSAQVNASKLPGIVLVDLEAVLNDVGPGKVAINLVETLDHLKSHATAAMEHVATIHSGAIGTAMNGSCGGVVLCGLMTGFTQRPSAYSYSWNVVSRCRTNEPGACSLVSQVAQLLHTMPF